VCEKYIATNGGGRSTILVLVAQCVSVVLPNHCCRIFLEMPVGQNCIDWAIHVLNVLVADNGERGPCTLSNWKQGIFSDQILRRFNKVQKVWMTIWGTWVWML
jgi:hypothetical protein